MQLGRGVLDLKRLQSGRGPWASCEFFSRADAESMMARVGLKLAVWAALREAGEQPRPDVTTKAAMRISTARAAIRTRR